MAIRNPFLCLSLWGLFAVPLFAAEPAPLVPSLTEPPKTIAFMGDSITHDGDFHHHFQIFLSTRYPGRDLWTTNHGHAGFKAVDMFNYKALELDFLPDPPDIVFIHFGMNDIRRSAEEYEENLTRLVDEMREAGSEVILLSPTPYDDLHTANPQAGENPWWNPKLVSFMAIGRGIAEKFSVPYIDLHSTIEKVNLEGQRKDPKFTVIRDRVHPRNGGEEIITYDLISALGLRSLVYDLKLDASGKATRSEGAELSDFESTDGTVRFQLTETALPFPTSSVSGGFKRVPFDAELNTMTLAITDLPAPRYELKIDTTSIGTFTREELAAGIDLAARKETPQFQAAAEIAREILSTKKTDQRAYADALALRNNLLNPIPPEGEGLDWTDIDPAAALDAANRMFDRLIAEGNKPTAWRAYVFAEGRKAFADWQGIHQRLANLRKSLAARPSNFTRTYELVPADGE